MSPIRASEKDKYPVDWPAVRLRILERASHACEWPGCAAAHGQWVLRDEADLESWFTCEAIDETVDNYPPGFRPVLVVLTIAHRNHDPADCCDANLAAWCQLHHLRYDARHHARNAAATRRAKRNNRELFA